MSCLSYWFGKTPVAVMHRAFNVQVFNGYPELVTNMTTWRFAKFLRRLAICSCPSNNFSCASACRRLFLSPFRAKNLRCTFASAFFSLLEKWRVLYLLSVWQRSSNDTPTPTPTIAPPLNLNGSFFGLRSLVKPVSHFLVGYLLILTRFVMQSIHLYHY